MFERGISRTDVQEVLRTSEIIVSYPDDKPYPSHLMLAFVGARALHVIVAVDAAHGRCIIVSAYVPDRSVWDKSYRRRK